MDYKNLPSHSTVENVHARKCSDMKRHAWLSKMIQKLFENFYIYFSGSFWCIITYLGGLYFESTYIVPYVRDIILCIIVYVCMYVYVYVYVYA